MLRYSRAVVAIATTLLASTAPATEGTTIAFSTGATVALPPAAQLVPRPQETPANLHSARLYRLGGTILVVTEPKLEGQSCQRRITAEWNQMQKNLTNGDPMFKALMRINSVERQSVDGSPALYSEVDSRSPEEASANKPYHAGLGYLFCKHGTAINLSLAALNGPLEPTAKATLVAMIKSFRLSATH